MWFTVSCIGLLLIAHMYFDLIRLDKENTIIFRNNKNRVKEDDIELQTGNEDFFLLVCK